MMVHEASPAGARPRRAWRVWTLAVLGCLCACVAGFPIASGRVEPPRFGRESAEQALAKARHLRAARWAPAELSKAESAMRISLFELRRQEVRFYLLRDFRTARASFLLAEDNARHAAAEAIRVRRQAEVEATSAISAADDEVSGADAFAEAMHLGVYERTLLQKSKLALLQAKLLRDSGEFPMAADRAGSAATLARQVGERAASAAARFIEPGLLRDWKHMVGDTVAWSRQTGQAAIVVCKENHRLTLYAAGKLVRVYRAELGYNSARDKAHAGDAATPEGRYRVTAKKGQGNSGYYKALLLNYPNDEDRVQFERDRRAGRLPRWARLGGLIEIHGEGGRGKDWTKGCVALSNPDIDDLFRRVGVGTPVTIVGSDGGDGGVFTELVRKHRNGNGSGTKTQ